METLSPADGSRVRRIAAELKDQPGPLLNILHQVQGELGCIPAGAVAILAETLNLSRAEVHGVVTFYHHFRRKPAGRHVVSLCQAEACQAVGAAALTGHAQRDLGVALHQTTADGAVTLEPVYCLGNCAAAPSAMIDGRLHGRLTAQRLGELVRGLRGAPGKGASGS
ncbi:MAG: formate dehydrogenase subunit gamma [Proteobacteria bacterium]|nr:formate dehydrogenase subunit gamma [Pseudomonadota bacterium]